MRIGSKMNPLQNTVKVQGLTEVAFIITYILLTIFQQL